MGEAELVAPVIFQILACQELVADITSGGEVLPEAALMPGLAVFFKVLPPNRFITAFTAQAVTMPHMPEGTDILV